MTASGIRADPCAYCLSAGGTIDHIEPRAHGGTSDRRNVTSACPTCNRMKGDTPLLLFLVRYGFPVLPDRPRLEPWASRRRRKRICRAFRRLDRIERRIRITKDGSR